MGNSGNAAGKGILYFLVFVALPLALINYMSEVSLGDGTELSDFVQFHGTQTYILIFGLLLSAFAATTAYFEKGSPHRLAAGTVAALFLVLWGYFLIKSMSIYYEGDTYSYEVLVPGIALILAIAFSVRIFYRLVEYAVYRREYQSFMSGPIPAPAPYVQQPEQLPPEPMQYEGDGSTGEDETQYF